MNQVDIAKTGNRRDCREQAERIRMAENPIEVRRPVCITNGSGLHLRPVSQFAEVAQRYRSEISIQHRGVCYDGKSILSLLSMGAEGGAWIELVARGTDAREAVESLSSVIADGHAQESAGPDL